MADDSASRFRFIGHALNGDGPFRPVVYLGSTGEAALSGSSYLVRYPREGDSKYARRNEVAFYASPLAQACSRFIGYIATKPVTRELPNPLFKVMGDDLDGKGNSIAVFLSQFMVNAKARGSLLLLVDMPKIMASSLGSQIQDRKVPYWTVILPELLTEYEVGDDGRFVFAEFAGNVTQDGKRVDCIWHFDREGWSCRDKKGNKTLDQGVHPLGECPLLIWTEGGDFPSFGPFSTIADAAKDLFNCYSELRELHRSQTFSILALQVPENTSEAQKVAMAQTAGQTVGTSNMLIHSGTAPTYVSPTGENAAELRENIKYIERLIDQVGLNVATINEQESGIAMQMRFQAINAELSQFSQRMEDFERRAWDLTRRWLGMTQAPTCEWPRDFNIADVDAELKILADMQAAAMPQEVITEQQKRIVNVQFGNLEQDRIDELNAAIDTQEQAIEPAGGNVVPIDRNSGVRDALVKSLNG